MESREGKRTLIQCFSIAFAAIAAILVHALMPSPGGNVNDVEMDSILVRWFGFPVVASLYFVLLYTQVCAVIRYYGKRSGMDWKYVGVRFGIAFALIDMVGMQEVVVDASPFSTWGLDFISFQFFMGLGDAIPVVILALVVAKTIPISERRKEREIFFTKRNLMGIIIIAVVILCARLVAYKSGLITSEIDRYPIPVLIWTLIFGLTLGCMVTMLWPMYQRKSKTLHITILTIGVNWIIFNSFIAMILADCFSMMLIRSGFDVIMLAIATWLMERLIRKDQLHRNDDKNRREKRGW